MTSKIELGVFSLFCAICAVVGGTTHALIEPIAPDEPASVIEEEDIVPTEPLPDITELEPTPTPEPITSLTTTPETTPSPEVTSSSIYVNDGYETTPGVTTLEDYVHYYAGLCPSEQPQNHRAWEHERFKTALGVWSQWPSPKHYIETYWEDWHYAPRTDTQHISDFANLGLENNSTNRNAGVFIDWSTWTVFWDASWEWNRPYIEKFGTNYPAEWDTTVAEMQSYLRELESRYRQLCPND